MTTSVMTAPGTAPGRELVAKLAKLFNDDNLESLRYLKDVPPGRGSTVYDLFKYLEEQGIFIPSRPSTIIPFLEEIERFDMLGVAKEWLEVKGYGNPEIGHTEGCIRDALKFLDKMDEKIQDAARSNDIAEVTHTCLRDILATAKDLVGRCLENMSSPIYAGLQKETSTYIVIRLHFYIVIRLHLCCCCMSHILT